MREKLDAQLHNGHCIERERELQMSGGGGNVEGRDGGEGSLK